MIPEPPIFQEWLLGCNSTAFAALANALGIVAGNTDSGHVALIYAIFEDLSERVVSVSSRVKRLEDPVTTSLAETAAKSIGDYRQLLKLIADQGHKTSYDEMCNQVVVHLSKVTSSVQRILREVRRVGPLPSEFRERLLRAMRSESGSLGQQIAESRKGKD